MQNLTDDLLEGASSIAAFLGKTERATYHLIYTNRIPCFRKGKRLFARKSEIEAAFRAEAA